MSEEDCPGEGKCHGCLCWCSYCGDVDAVCDYPECDQHHCAICGEKLCEATQAESDRPTWCIWCDRDIEVAQLKRRADSLRGVKWEARALELERQAAWLEKQPL